MQKIIVDPIKCIGCGLCVSIAEDCFRLNDQGKAEGIGGCEGNGGCGCDERCGGKVKEAAESCPVAAIKNE